MTNLSVSDASLLDRLFSNATPSSPPVAPTHSAPPTVDAAILRDEARAVQLAEEADQLEPALECTVAGRSAADDAYAHRVTVLDDVVRRAPSHASALNNR
jgi:hypothetical protein